MYSESAELLPTI